MGRSKTGIGFNIMWYSWALPLCVRANKYTDEYERTNYSGVVEDVGEDYFYLTIQFLCFELTYTKLLREYILPPIHYEGSGAWFLAQEGKQWIK
jgi:hypothetical protein